MTPVLLETIASARRLTPKGGSWYTTLVAPVRIGARVWIGATVVLLTDRRVSE
jgi:acetyltransferase-like isoleucine patch superfamily enzyme